MSLRQRLPLLLLGLSFLVLMEAANAELSELTVLLAQSWASYKQQFIQADGRVIDHASNITTSEGQSYAMLRALWMRDKAAFDQTYTWAKNNLQIPRGDHLFSWKWGERPDHTWGALDRTSATDADQDIALALLMATEIWQDPSYQADALPILNDIWNKLTVEAPIGRVLLPGDWPNAAGKTYQVNPSYLAPYAYRIFNGVDSEHNWDQLLDTSYEILEQAVNQPSTHLPPDWVEVSLDNDLVKLYPEDTRSDFGYDATRVHWRLAVDELLHPLDKRPLRILNVNNVFPRYWQVRQEVPVGLTWDGIPRLAKWESAAVSGASLPSYYHQDIDLAEAIVQKRIIPALKPGNNSPQDYYSQNWLWLGLALYNSHQNPPMVTRGSDLSRLIKLMQLHTNQSD